MLPSTRNPVSDNRRAPRCRSSSCRTSSGINRSSALLGASRCVAGSSSRTQRPGYWIGRGGGQRFRLSAERSVECLSDVFRVPESPCQREPRNADECANRFQAKSFERTHRVWVETEGGNMKRCEAGLDILGDDGRSIMTECPGRRGGGRDGDAGREPNFSEPPVDIVSEAAFSAEQVRNSSDVEPQAVVIYFHERRPAAGPARQPPDQRRIALRISGNRHQRRVERARIGQPGAGFRASCRRDLGGGMDDRPVRAFDGEDNRIVRRVGARFRPTLHRQRRQPNGTNPLHERGASGRAVSRARGIARHSMPARPARVRRDR